MNFPPDPSRGYKRPPTDSPTLGPKLFRSDNTPPLSNQTMDEDPDISLSQDVLGFDEKSNRFVVANKSLEDYEEIPQSSTARKAAKSDEHEHKQKPPPIVIVGKNVSSVQSVLTKKIKSKKFEIKLMRLGIKVQLSDVAGHKIGMNKLETAGFEFSKLLYESK